MEGVSDSGLDEEMMTRRREREARSLENVKRQSQNIRDLKSLRTFMGTVHRAYYAKYDDTVVPLDPCERWMYSCDDRPDDCPINKKDEL